MVVDFVRLCAGAHDPDGGLGLVAAGARHRRLGQQHHSRVGLPDCQLRVVDRHRQCRHADLFDAAAAAAALACLDQPLCRGDGAVCRRHRRAVSDHASRPAAVFLLAAAVPEHDGGVAAVAQRVDLGFLGDLQLYPVLNHLLVHRSRSRSRDGSRPRQEPGRARAVRDFRARLARLGAALACLPRLSHHHGLPRRAAGHLAAQRGRARFRRQPDAGMVGDDLSRPISSSAPCIPASPW